MYRDGYYVSFFSDDAKKEGEPKSIVVIRNGKVESISPNPSEKNAGGMENLKGLALILRSMKPGTEEYDFTLGNRFRLYWEYNGYQDKPSDFISLEDYDGKYDDIIQKWKV